MRASRLPEAILILFSVLAFPAVLAAAEPTPAEVRELTLRAVDLIEERGLDAAREAFNREGDYRFGELSVNVVDFKGIRLIYPPRPSGIGLSALDHKDADGRALVQEIIAVARDKGEGWVQYRRLDPQSNRIEPRIGFVKRIPGRELAAYVGVPF
jgi:signal transduction histidine kinase